MTNDAPTTEVPEFLAAVTQPDQSGRNRPAALTVVRHAGRESVHVSARPRDRFFWLLLAAAALSVLAVARLLHPSSSGYGTHTQLGLPACVFLAWTGLPCPACGFTTCFAHMARGELSLAVHSNALGVGLFAGTTVLAPLAVWASVRGRAFCETFARMQPARACLLFAALALLQWVVRVACLLLG